jgi:hypothetical protein
MGLLYSLMTSSSGCFVMILGGLRLRGLRHRVGVVGDVDEAEDRSLSLDTGSLLPVGGALSSSSSKVLSISSSLSALVGVCHMTDAESLLMADFPRSHPSKVAMFVLSSKLSITVL